MQASGPAKKVGSMVQGVSTVVLKTHPSPLELGRKLPRTEPWLTSKPMRNSLSDFLRVIVFGDETAHVREKGRGGGAVFGGVGKKRGRGAEGGVGRRGGGGIGVNDGGVDKGSEGESSVGVGSEGESSVLVAIGKTGDSDDTGISVSVPSGMASGDGCGNSGGSVPLI